MFEAAYLQMHQHEVHDFDAELFQVLDRLFADIGACCSDLKTSLQP
ncbi:MAG: hypothetical protein GY798_04760 [Hyphomicrobiales bacterium]|nr:hypothetical protein [Hyphomicrobiales bacterium]